VTNRQLDYLIGVPRAILPSTFVLEGGRIKFQDKTADQRAIELKKGLVGAAGLIAVGIAGMPGDDDEERGWAIHGGGPSNPNARAVLSQTGWKPWSLQIGDTYIPFRYLPIGIGLASVAEMHDHARYKDKSAQTSLDKVAYGLSSVGAATLDASFLSNLSDFLGAVGQRDGDARAQALQRFVQRTVNAGSLVPFSNLILNVTVFCSVVLRPAANFVGCDIRGDGFYLRKRLCRSRPCWSGNLINLASVDARYGVNGWISLAGLFARSVIIHHRGLGPCLYVCSLLCSLLCKRKDSF